MMFVKLATTIVAGFTALTISSAALAQQPPAASASASTTVSVPTAPPAASASASATTPPPAPKPAASPFLIQKRSEGLTQYQLIASIIGEFSKRMSAGAQGAFDETAGKMKAAEAKKMREGIGNLPKGIADEIDIAVGKYTLVKTLWEAYLAANSCTKVADGTKDNGGVETWSPACAALAAKLVPIADKVIAAAPQDSPSTKNALFLMGIAKGMASQAPAITDRSDLMIALIHYAVLMVPPEFWPFENDLVSSTGTGPGSGCASLIGKQACFHKGDKLYCGKITKVTEDGVEVDGESISFGELLSGTAKPTWADEHPFTVSAQYMMSFGSASGYTGAYLYAMMACGAYNPHNNVDLHACIGGGSIVGTSKVGVNEGDSSAMLVTKAGVDVVLAPISLPVVPFAGANFLFLGSGVGGEGVLGAKIWPDGPADIRVMGTAGCYATGKTPATHPDPNVSVPSFTLCGGGFAVQGGINF